MPLTAHLLGHPAVALFQVLVVVPIVADPGLHEADSPFHQSARDQGLPGLGAFPIHAANRLGFPTDVERLGCFQLHARGQFKGLDAGLELRVLVAILAVTFIEFPQEFELPALVRVGHRPEMDQ